jgi:hypothetical protein
MEKKIVLLWARVDFLGADLWPEPAELNATGAVNQRCL